MNVTHEIAEARAAALSLQASAQACRPEQGPLKFRLMPRGRNVDAIVLLAVRCLDRIEMLEQQLKVASRQKGQS